MHAFMGPCQLGWPHSAPRPHDVPSSSVALLTPQSTSDSSPLHRHGGQAGKKGWRCKHSRAYTGELGTRDAAGLRACSQALPTALGVHSRAGPLLPSPMQRAEALRASAVLQCHPPGLHRLHAGKDGVHARLPNRQLELLAAAQGGHQAGRGREAAHDGGGRRLLQARARWWAEAAQWSRVAGRKSGDEI